MSDFYRLPKFNISTIGSDERVGLATLLCMQAAELLEGIANFDWEISELTNHQEDLIDERERLLREAAELIARLRKEVRKNETQSR